MELASDFNEFCGLLNANHVEFVIVGGYALAFHGSPRFTGDLDIYVRPTEANGRHLLAAIEAFGFPSSALTPSHIVDTRCLIQMGVVPVQIHIMSDISGVSWDDVWRGRTMGRCGDHEVAFIGRDEFLRNKKASGRLQDLADVEALEGSG